MELKIINNKGQETGSVQFQEALVQSKASPAVLHEVIVAFNAKKRSGTHGTLTRAEVTGSGAKPWRQKGTGNARSGDKRSPLWRKGGIIFGPVPRDYTQSLPTKKKKLAFRMAVKGLLDDNRLQVVEPIQISEPKTKTVAAVYASWKAPTHSFFIIDKRDPQFERASRNIPNVTVTDVASMNVYDCLRARRVFITAAALEQLSARIVKHTEAKS